MTGIVRRAWAVAFGTTLATAACVSCGSGSSSVESRPLSSPDPSSSVAKQISAAPSVGSPITREVELDALVAAIDRDPDPLHRDFTPASHELARRGVPGALAVLQLLDAPELWTRRRAQRVVEGVAMRRLGWRPGRGFLGDPHEGEAATRKLLADNGSYDPEAPATMRKGSIAKWRIWLNAQTASSP